MMGLFLCEKNWVFFFFIIIVELFLFVLYIIDNIDEKIMNLEKYLSSSVILLVYFIILLIYLGYNVDIMVSCLVIRFMCYILIYNG